MSKVHCALPGDSKLKVNAGPTAAPEHAPKDLGQTEPLLCADREPKHLGQRRPRPDLGTIGLQGMVGVDMALGKASWGLWTLRRPLERAQGQPRRICVWTPTDLLPLMSTGPPGDSGNLERQQPLVPVPGGDPEPRPLQCSRPSQRGRTWEARHFVLPRLNWQQLPAVSHRATCIPAPTCSHPGGSLGSSGGGPTPTPAHPSGPRPKVRGH